MTEGQNTEDVARVRADIAVTRADLGQTVEALAAKTRVRARAQDAARGAVADVTDRVKALPSQGRSGAVGLWHWGTEAASNVLRTVTRPLRKGRDA